MALLKVYTLAQNKEFLEKVSATLKLVASTALNCEEFPTSPSDIEIVYGEGINLAGIEFIIEIIACKRPHLDQISNQIISKLNDHYPDKLFSVYFVIVSEEGMSHSPRN